MRSTAARVRADGHWPWLLLIDIGVGGQLGLLAGAVVVELAALIAPELHRRLCTEFSLAEPRLGYLLVIDLVDVARQAAGEKEAENREHGDPEGAARHQADVALYEGDHAVVAALREMSGNKDG